MIFSVSKDCTAGSLDFGPDSVTLTVKDLVQEMTISSQEVPLVAWSWLLSQKQQFLNNHLARIPATPNQRAAHEMRVEVLSSVGAQDMDTRAYQVLLIWTMLILTGKMTSWMWTLFLDRALLLLFQQQGLTTWRWEKVHQKTPFCSTKSTRRTLLLLQQHQSLRDEHDPLHCLKVVHFEQE